MPLYPGSGARGERGAHDTIVNAPLRQGDGGKAFREAYETAMPRFGPTALSRSKAGDYSGPQHHDDRAGLRNPYNMTWILNLQYQLAANYLLPVTYDGSAGVGNLETPQYNALPWNYALTNASNLTAFLGNSQIYRPFPNYGTINLRGNFSHSTYHAGTVQIAKRLSRGLQFNGFYTLSRASMAPASATRSSTAACIKGSRRSTAGSASSAT